MKHFLILFTGVMLMALSSCADKKNESAHNDGAYYTCSMHPQVIADAPGLCPICHMDLTLVEKNNNADPKALSLNEEQIKLGNIQTDTIRKGFFGDKIILTGILNFNQYHMQSVSSRVMGRVERLYYKNTGDYVEKGMPLIDIYSEQLNNAKQEYLLALERKEKLADIDLIDFDQLIQSSGNKLKLWGMTEAQIEALGRSGAYTPTTTFYSTRSGYITDILVEEGGYIGEGGTIINVADLSTLWAEVQAYSSQMAGIYQAQTANVSIPDLGNKTIAGKIEFTNPELNPDSRINLIRVAIDNPNKELKPGMPVYVFLEPARTNTITMPIDAVIRISNKASVWIQTAEKTFKSKPVKTGLETGNRIEITAGLEEGDVVVTSGTYLLYSEFIFKNGTESM